MKWGSSLLALLPLAPPAELPRQPPACAIAIELQVKTPVAWGAREWHIMTAEVDRIWAPYGVTICWADGSNPCAGWEVRLRVLVADDVPRVVRPAGVSRPVVGRILFDAGGPRTDIALSMTAARGLVARAKFGDRRFEDLPTSTWNTFLPRVLGRALAHEVGHYVLGSRAHTRTGLMTAALRPYDATFGPSSWFCLTPDEVSALHLRWPVRSAEPRVARLAGAIPVIE